MRDSSASVDESVLTWAAFVFVKVFRPVKLSIIDLPTACVTGLADTEHQTCPKQLNVA